MHQTIIALVRAYDKGNAREQGEDTFKKLVEASRSYDSFRIESVYKYDSEKGKSLLQMVFGHQTIEFNEHLAEIRKTLLATPAKPDEQLMEDHSFRFHCWEVGQDDGSAIRVYDSDAAGVSDKDHLKNVIDDWPTLVESGQHTKSPYPLWVVTADGHY